MAVVVDVDLDVLVVDGVVDEVVEVVLDEVLTSFTAS